MACTFQSNFIKPDPDTLHINTWIKLNHKETKEWGHRIRSEGVHLLYKFNKEILKSFGISYSDTNWTLDLSLNKQIRAKNIYGGIRNEDGTCYNIYGNSRENEFANISNDNYL